MKIYVSEKDINLKLLNKNKEMFVGGEFNVESPVDDDYGNYILAEVEDETEIISLEQHETEIRKLLEDEIIELKEHVRALKSSHYLSHQAYLFAKNEGLDLQKQARLKVIAELEEWVDKKDFTTNVPCDLGCCELGKVKCVTSYQLKQKLNEMKGVKK